MNRYDNGSVSRFNPLSLNEIMLAPMAQRQKHDNILAQQELLRQGLLRVDPLDVHLDEAVKLREDMNSKLTAQAEQLAKEGVNPNSQSSFLALNRQYQDLVSPTGRIGQINNAKKVYFDNLKEYLDDATKNKGWSRERALAQWQTNRHDNYTGFDENGNITNIDNYGAPKKIDVLDKLKITKDLLGEQVVNEIMASGYQVIKDPNTGEVIFADSKGRRIETSNKPNLQNAQKLLTQQLNEKEWRDSIEFEGTTPQAVDNQIVNGLNAMLSNKVVDNRVTDHTFYQPKDDKTKTDPTDSNAEGYSLDTVNFSSNSELLSKLDAKDTNLPDSYSGGTGGASNQAEPRNLKEIKNQALASQEYRQIANGLARNDKSLVGVKYDDPKMISAVKGYLKENKDVAIDNGYVTPDKEQSNSLFESASDKKTAGERSFTLQQRVATGSAQMYDSKTGKPLSQEDVENMKTIQYVGFMKPKSIVKMEAENPNQKIMPTIANYIDKDGNNKSVYVSRDPKDFDKPFFKAAKVVNAFGKIADSRPNIYHKITDPELASMGLHNIELKKNKNSGTYNMSAEIRGKNNELISFDKEFKNDADLQNFIYDAYDYNQQ